MVSLTLIMVGFLLATAAVMALARASTARWERDKRAAVAVRADGSTRRTSAAGSASGRVSAATRAGLASVRDHISRLPPVTVLAQLLRKRRQQGTTRVQPTRRLVGVLRSSLSGQRFRRGGWTKSRAPALPFHSDGADAALAPEPSRAAPGIRAGGAAKAARRQLLRGTVPRGRRRALAFLHRHEETQDAHTPREDRDESPTAR